MGFRAWRLARHNLKVQKLQLATQQNRHFFFIRGVAWKLKVFIIVLFFIDASTLVLVMVFKQIFCTKVSWLEEALGSSTHPSWNWASQHQAIFGHSYWAGQDLGNWGSSLSKRSSLRASCRTNSRTVFHWRITVMVSVIEPWAYC